MACDEMKPPTLDAVRGKAHAMCANASCCYEFGWHIHCGAGCPCPDCYGFHAAIDLAVKVARLEQAERLFRCPARRLHEFLNVEKAHAHGVVDGERRYSCGATNDCTRHPMFCGHHHLEIRDNLMQQARAAGSREGFAEGRRAQMAEHAPLCESDKDYQRAAGVAEGRRGMAREALEQVRGEAFVPTGGILPMTVNGVKRVVQWLESEASEEKEAKHA